ncbi:MAG: hypothetical protein FJW39_21340 [Acidobacteria bacterium]|nr:hypothetical protein [Acidobacteriota bacterium]
MKHLKTLAAALLLAGALAAQDNKPEAAIIPVKTLSGDAFDRLVKMLQVFNTRFTADDKLRTIVVYAPKDVIAEVRRVVEELDKPGTEAAIGRNIDLSVTYLRASLKPFENQAPLPPDMEAVAKQIRAATAYKHVQVWDSTPMRLQEGKRTEHSARLPGPPAPAIPVVKVSIHPESIWRKAAGRAVRFSFVSFDFRIPYLVSHAGPDPAPGQYQFYNSGITTSGDFMEGQKSVLGKVSASEDHTAVFVVISPKILD